MRVVVDATGVLKGKTRRALDSTLLDDAVPTQDTVISTIDPDARHMHKSVSEYRDGYKAHLAVEPETGLITAAAITPANAADGPAGVG